MQKIIFIFSFLLIAKFSVAQVNLVPNPSFEDTVACPHTLGLPQNAMGWTSFRNTPDYFNSCSANTTNASVPSNVWGYQYPSTGNAYMAVQTRFTSEFREYLGRQLSSSLIIGQKYYVSFKVNCAFGGAAGANCAANKIGMLFSTNPYSSSTPTPINNFAHVYSDLVITDTLNWTNIQGSFTADSAYKYVVLGNFFDDAHTDTTKLDATPNYCRSSYYIDDVIVSTDSTLTTSNETKQENISFEIFPNPASNVLSVRLNDIQANLIVIYNSFGHVMYVNSKTPQHNSFNINVTQYPKGIYLLQLLTDKGTLTKRLIINPD